MLWCFLSLQEPIPLHLITRISFGLSATVTGVASIRCNWGKEIYFIWFGNSFEGLTRRTLGGICGCVTVTSSEVTSPSSWSSTTPESSKDESLLFPSPLLLLACLLCRWPRFGASVLLGCSVSAPRYSAIWMCFGGGKARGSLGDALLWRGEGLGLGVTDLQFKISRKP